MKKVQLRIPEPLHERVVQLSGITGNSQNDIAIQALELVCAMAESGPKDRPTIPKVVVFAQAAKTKCTL